jgi:hypothetical protein
MAPHGENAEALSQIIALLIDQLRVPGHRLSFDGMDGPAPTTDADHIEVVAPGSVATNVHRDNREFRVQEVFYSPKGLRYRGVYSDCEFTDGTTTVLALKSLVRIPGVTHTALYDLNLGVIVDPSGVFTAHADSCGTGANRIEAAA